MGKKSTGTIDYGSLLNSFQSIIAPKNDEQKELMKEISKNKITFVKGAPGTGKCINPDSFISTDTGIIKFRNIIPEMKNDEFIKHETMIINRFGVSEKTSHIYNSGTQKTLKISTKFGYSIEGTHNHRILCLTKDGIVWKTLDSISEEDFACIHRGQQYDNIESDIDEETAYFVGIMIGDGCYTLSNTFSLSNIDTYVIRFFLRFCRDRLNHIPKQSLSRPCDYVVCSKSARESLINMGLMQVKGDKKSIPNQFLTAGKGVHCALLRGLFDTDGWIEKSGQICFLNKSTQLCEQIHQLLLRLGIVSRYKIVTKKYKNLEINYGMIKILLSSLSAFNELIGFNIDYKQSSLEFILSKKRNTNVDIIPSVYSKNLLRDYLNKFESKDRNRETNRIFHRHITDNENIFKGLSYDKLSKIYCRFRDKYPNKDIESVLTSNYFFDRVTSIKSNEIHVYDFSVPKTHSFVANGFVNHNTFVSVTFAIHQLLQNKCEKIVFTRPIIEAAGEKLGFLPGDMCEKINPYMIPIFDTLFDLIPHDVINKLMTKNGSDAVIRVLPLAFMRGTTFKKSIVIIDESQNSTPEQMRMLLTRIGEGTRMIICGDVEQSDINVTNGLEDAFSLLQGIEGIGFVTMTQEAIVRDKIVKEIDLRYTERKRLTPKQ